MTEQTETSGYEAEALALNAKWRKQVEKRPGIWDGTTRAVQDRINRIVPEKVHQVVTATIKQLTQAIMTGSGWITTKPLTFGTLEQREDAVRDRIMIYRRTASVEGGVAGAGGFVLAAVDLPALMAIKIKLLFEISALYGHDSQNPAERLFMLRTFQLAFSSARHRPQAFQALQAAIPDPHKVETLENFDWRHFQLEYRDYIDLVKLAQLLPVIGAPVGAVANWHLTQHLANTAIQAYRLRWFKETPPS